MFSLATSLSLAALLTDAGLANPVAWKRQGTNLPARYNGSVAGATWLYTPQNGSPYAEIPFQAINGSIIFTKEPPGRTCPCSDEFGAANYTAYYVGDSSDVPSLQLFTSSAGEQTVYIGRDLGLHYTAPGAHIPKGANATAISFFDAEPLGPGFPNGAVGAVRGFVTQANGTRTYFNNLQACKPHGSPESAIHGQGPLTVFAIQVPEDNPQVNSPASDGCVETTLFTTVDDPAAGPDTIDFQPPTEPAAMKYL